MNPNHQKFSLVQIGLIAFGVIACTLAIFNRAIPLGGPAIFGDELAYFEMMKTFAQTKVLTTLQYGPLYPVLGSLFYSDENVFLFYDRLRIFNTLIFSMSFAPLFFLSREQGISDRVSFVLAGLCVLLPWSTLTPFIWAESLFYFLYCCGWYWALRCFKRPSKKAYLFLGLTSALLLLTKQLGIGFTVGFVVIRIFSVFVDSKLKKNLLKDMFFFSLPHLIALTFYAWNKLANPSAGAMGYSNATSIIQEAIFSLLISKELYITVFYQISYTFIACFALPFLIIVSCLFFPKRFNFWQNQMNILVLLVLFIVSGLISLFYNTFEQSYHIKNETFLTNGRYLAPFIPVFIISSYALIPNFLRKPQWKVFSLVTFSSLILLGVFSPLKSLYSLGIANSQDTMFLSRWLGETYPPWTEKSALEFAQTSAWTIVFYLAAIIVVLRLAVYYRPFFLACIAYLSIMNSGVNAKNVGYLGDVGRNEHKAIRHLVENRVDLKNIYFDKSIFMLDFNWQFWFGIETARAWMKTNSIESYNDLPNDSWVVMNRKNLSTNAAAARVFGDYAVVKKETPDEIKK